jgi:hypothetical protein
MSSDPLNSGNPSPDARTVADFHKFDDVDRGPNSHHHTIGTSSGQVSDGGHNHNGSNSAALLAGVTFTGSVSTNTAAVLKQVTTALALLGAVDATVT